MYLDLINQHKNPIINGMSIFLVYKNIPNAFK